MFSVFEDVNRIIVLIFPNVERTFYVHNRSIIYTIIEKFTVQNGVFLQKIIIRIISQIIIFAQINRFFYEHGRVTLNIPIDDGWRYSRFIIDIDSGMIYNISYRQQNPTY